MYTRESVVYSREVAELLNFFFSLISASRAAVIYQRYVQVCWLITEVICCSYFDWIVKRLRKPRARLKQKMLDERPASCCLCVCARMELHHLTYIFRNTRRQIQLHASIMLLAKKTFVTRRLLSNARARLRRARHTKHRNHTRLEISRASTFDVSGRIFQRARRPESIQIRAQFFVTF